MNLDAQALNEGASRLATARYDRESANQDAGGTARAGHPLRLAMIFKIPVGYQDEAGFHQGEPRVQKTAPWFEPEAENTERTNTYQF
jgi:hypothetical protein